MIERRSAATAVWAVRLSSFALVLFVVSGLGHRFGLVETVAFFWLLGIVGALAILGLCCAAAGFHRLWEFGERAGRKSLLATVLALLVLAPYGVSLYRLAMLPALTDISTDTADPPALQARAGSPAPEIDAGEAEQIAANYPSVTGRRYEAPAEIVVELVDELLAARGWEMAGSAKRAFAGADLTIDATAPSFFLGFPSDVAIRVTDEGQSTYVDMRSASRYGRHDLGDNARRIASFLGDLDEAVAAAAGSIADGQEGE